MANADRPCGLKPVGKIRQTAVREAGSTVYPGDPITVADDGQVDLTVAGTGTVDGVALAYATVGQAVLCSVHPTQLYEVQADEADISAQTLVGQTADILDTAGNTTYKTSRVELDSSTAGSSKQLLVVGLSPEVDNAFGTNAKVIVKINNHQSFGVDAFGGI